MRILYIAQKYDYGKPEKGFSFEHHNFYETLVKMNGSGHEVIYFPFDEVMRDVGRDKMNKKLLEVVEKKRPDLCFFFIFTDEIKKKTIKRITGRGDTVTFNWFTDDHWRFSIYSRHWAPFFNWVSTTDSKAPAKYKKVGYENVIKTQWACNHFVYKRIGEGLKHDVTFVGQPHGGRREIVDDIGRAGVPIECWGGGWPNGRIGQDDMIKLFSESKINLNLTMSSGSFRLEPIAKIFINRRVDDSYQLRNPVSWPANFISWASERTEQIKGRNFEVPGSGGFLLTSDADNLTDYFEDGREIVIFKDTADLIDKAKYYLSHENERASIAEAGYQRTIRDHTYEKRFNDIFTAMGF